jgi:hypothetical protein
MSDKDLYGERSAGGSAVAAGADRVTLELAAAKAGMDCKTGPEIPA